MRQLCHAANDLRLQILVLDVNIMGVSLRMYFLFKNKNLYFLDCKEESTGTTL